MKTIFNNIRTLCNPSAIDSDQDYLKAVEFKKEMEPVEGVDYDWVWDYARGDFDRLYGISKELEDKANDIIKYLGGGTGLFTLAVLANIRPDNAAIVRWAIPSFLCAVSSIIFAALVRQPNDVFLPARTKAAVRYAEYFKETWRAKAKFVGQWHLASEGMVLVNRRKAKWTAYATWAFVLAIILLVLPIVAAISKVSQPLPG